MSKLDGSKGHTSIVIELAGQEEPEYQRAYEVDFSDLDIPRDYVIDQIYCGENVTVYAVFEISEDGRKADQHEQSFNDGNYRIFCEGSSAKVISDEQFCQFQGKLLSNNDIKLPPTESCGRIYAIPKEEQNYIEEENGACSKALVAPQKISLGTNTSLAKFTPLFFEKTAENIEVENKTTQNSEGQESQQKEKNKIAILKEIKKLQKKVNSLIRTIECNDFDLDADDFEISAADSTSFEEAPKCLDVGVKLKPPDKKHKKFDDIPIFSPLTYSTSSRRTLPKQKKTKSVRQAITHEIPVTLTRSISQLSIGSSPTQIIISGDKSDTTLRKVSSECSINWQQLEDWRGAGLSKSEVINHVILVDPKYNIMKGVRKSLSLELRNDKLEVICLKKIKNYPFKLEGSLKSKGNVRILPKRDPSLRESLPLLKREMGDEANKKTKTSKVDLLGLVQVCDKQNALSFEKINLTPNKNLNEDEGDAKLVYPKKNLASPRFARRNTELEVHFCSATNNTPSDGLLKNEKNIIGKKLKVKPLENSVDPALKVCSDSEKPTTPVRKSRKATTASSEGKKEAKPIKKSNKKTPRDKFEKTDGRDASSQERAKTRPVASSSRHSSRSHTESKIHVDRPVKSDVTSGHKTSHSAKQNFEEKPACKADRLPRLISQKKEAAEPPNDCVEIREKETKTLKKNPLAVNLSHKKSASDLTCVKPETCPLEYQKEKGLDEEKSSEQRPPVVVELFSEKPQPGKIVSSDDYNEYSTSNQNPEDLSVNRENDKEEEINGGDSDEFKKPVVKSLWALTKLILFEDGTQKLEILEASLNPPEWV